jgi:hypothetical protein
VKRRCKQQFHDSEFSQKTLHCKDFGSLSTVQTIKLSRPDAHLTTIPSVRTTCHTVRTPVRPSIIRSDDFYFLPDPPLCQEGSIQLAYVRTFQKHVRKTLGTQPVSESFQVPIKERSFDRSDDVVSRLDGRLRKARITIQISPSGRLTVLVRTCVQLIWKLSIRLQLFGRLLLMVRMRA